MFPRISETEVLPPLNGATISAPVTRPTNRPRCACSGKWSTGTCTQIEHRNPNLPGVPTYTAQALVTCRRATAQSLPDPVIGSNVKALSPDCATEGACHVG